MKTQVFKNIGHEIGYVALATSILVILTVLVFPLFIAALPFAIIVGCLAVWHLDHLKKTKHMNHVH